MWFIVCCAVCGCEETRKGCGLEMGMLENFDLGLGKSVVL
jgi:hypothetical protein